MSARVAKKLTTFDAARPTAAIIMANLTDSQLGTVVAFRRAAEERNLRFFYVLNKSDLVSAHRIDKTVKTLGGEIIVASMRTGRGLPAIGRRLKVFPQGARVVVLGIFNSGKSSLIKALTRRTDIRVSDMPGTTLEFLEYNYGRLKLVDSVGQIIDVSKPMMTSIDFDGCKSLREKVNRVFQEELAGLEATTKTAPNGIMKAVRAIHKRLIRGGKLILTGAGASALVAAEGAGQAYETGIPALCFTNNYADSNPVAFAKGIGENEGGLARYMAMAVQPCDVAVAISASGGTGFVYDFLRRAREKRALTVAITENPDTPLGKNAKIVIKSDAKPEGPSSSKIQLAHLAIIHALILCLASDRGVSAEQSIDLMLPEPVLTKKMGIK